MSKKQNLDEIILKNASAPKFAEIDGQKVEQHSLSEQIAADVYLATKKAIKSRNSGIKITKMSHSGA